MAAVYDEEVEVGTVAAATAGAGTTVAGRDQLTELSDSKQALIDADGKPRGCRTAWPFLEVLLAPLHASSLVLSLFRV